jgi:hypothetical protein
MLTETRVAKSKGDIFRRKGDLLTPAEMLDWLGDEIRTVNRATELRLREASEIAVAYAKGDITPEEANRRFSLHSNQWRDVIHGGLIIPPGGLTDEEIHRSIEESQGAGEFSNRIAHEREAKGKKRLPEH